MPRNLFSDNNPIGYLLGLFTFAISRMHSFIVICICIIILLIFNSSNPKSQSLRENGIEIATYINTTVSSPIYLFYESYRTFKEFLSRFTSNAKLIEENKRLNQYISELEILAGENNRLKELLNFEDNAQHSEVLVRILSNSFGTLHKTFTINIGLNAGIKEGSILVNEDGLIGRVAMLTDTTSKIQVITDVNSKIPAVFTRSRKKCVLVGEGLSNNSLEASLTEPGISVEDGEPVVTSGDGDLIPYGILVGFAYNDGKKIKVKTSVNWAELDFGKIIINQRSK